MDRIKRWIGIGLFLLLISPAIIADDNTVALWAQGAIADALDWSGSLNTVDGLVHSDGGIKLGGSDNILDGATHWVIHFENGGGNNTFIPAPVQVAATTWPFNHQLTDYQP